MAMAKDTNVKVKANYDLLSVDGNIDLWGVTFERGEDGYYASLSKEQAEEMATNGRVVIVE
jgi:hypothetical protein